MQITEILKYVEKNENSAFFYTPNIYNNAKSYWFKKPVQILSGKTKAEVEIILAQVDKISQDHEHFAFATIPYEVGYFFQPKEIKQSYLNKTALNIYIYHKNDVDIIDSSELKFDGVEKLLSAKYSIRNLKLDISKNEYLNKIDTIKKHIAEGDTYQINFTTKAKFNFSGDLIQLFLQGIFNQSARYSALINSKEEFILSFSPELFFSTDYKNILCKPMKGTVKRKGNPIEDKKLAKFLMHDEKNKAENVMIVDLMRNDVGRISKVNSVKVEKLYSVEKYETLFQLTSTVVGKLNKNKLSKIFKNLFPSGSITGAPKIRSMQIIAELEKSKRNFYTGSIGIITSEHAVFNIPIRTIIINKSTRKGEMGLGSGIVWDSNAEEEYQEVLLKGKFINFQQQYFELLETMLFEDGMFFLLNYHIKRLQKSADYFLFKFDKNKILGEIKKETEKLGENKKYKIRLKLNKWGFVQIDTVELNLSFKKAKVLLSKVNRCKYYKFLFNKTTYRPWDEQLKKTTSKGFDEVLFISENNELLEGAITNVIVMQNGKYYTPPINLGILNGCYRQYLLDENKVEEKMLYVKDLINADEIILCNSVRKEIVVKCITNWEGKEIYKYKSKNL